MALADRAAERQEPSSETLSENSLSGLRKRLDAMSKTVREELASQGFADERIAVERFLNCRFEGTDTALMVLETDKSFKDSFFEMYKQEFGFVLEDKNVIVDDVRVRGIGKTFDSLGKSVFAEADELEFKSAPADAQDGTTSVYFDQKGRIDTPIYLADKLETGHELRGPAIIVDGTATIVVDPDANVRITSKHLLITLG